jgi:tetratricopeptide (TPR) repeat protein
MNNVGLPKRFYPLFFFTALWGGVFLYSCATWRAAPAEEYFSLGMAYFELGKFEEAEKWLNRARMIDKTKTASEYNLGRIAFETGRYGDAVKLFNAVLKKDPQNVMALKAAAYTQIKAGELAAAEEYYQKVLALVPESADDGYNYALVLYAVKKYAAVEEVLSNYPFALLDNNDVLLLFARAQAAQDKIEAADSYAQWLVNNSDPKVRYEYAQVLEKAELYARALEEYRTALNGLTPDGTDPKRPDILYAIGRLLLIADAESAEGLSELKAAVSEGFAGTAALEALLTDERISAANREGIAALIDETKQAAAAPGPAPIEGEGDAKSSETDVQGGSDSADEG